MKRTTTQILGVVLLAAVLALTGQASAANYYWDTTSGSYSTTGNWNPAGTPGGSDNVYISNGGTANLDQSASVPTWGYDTLRFRITNGSTLNIDAVNPGTSTDATLNVFNKLSNSGIGLFYVGEGSGDVGNLAVNSGRLFVRNHSPVANNFRIGYSGGTGHVQVNGGELDAYSHIALDSGDITVTGGTLTSRFGALNNNGGDVLISGGTVNIAQDVQNGFSGDASFTVAGSGANSISIGGFVQGLYAGTTRLISQIDAGGIDVITVDGNVNFGDGTGTSYFKPEALAGAEYGTYTVMTWTGLLSGESNLQLDPTVDSSLWSYNFDGGTKTMTVTYVPEPATLALLGMGGLALLRRRRKA